MAYKTERERERERELERATPKSVHVKLRCISAIVTQFLVRLVTRIYAKEELQSREVVQFVSMQMLFTLKLRV